MNLIDTIDMILEALLVRRDVPMKSHVIVTVCPRVFCDLVKQRNLDLQYDPTRQANGLNGTFAVIHGAIVVMPRMGQAYRTIEFPDI